MRLSSLHEAAGPSALGQAVAMVYGRDQRLARGSLHRRPPDGSGRAAFGGYDHGDRVTGDGTPTGTPLKPSHRKFMGLTDATRGSVDDGVRA